MVRLVGMASVAMTGWPIDGDGDLELVAAARHGDRDAADRLLSRHEMVVHRTCRHLLPPGEDVEATAQEALLRALRALPTFSGHGTFPGWLATIAINLCRDRVRRRRLVPFVALDADQDDDSGRSVLAVTPSGAPDPERVAMARQAVDRVRREVAGLPTRQREVFALRFFVGLELEAIAEALEVDLGTVKTHLHRAVHKVRAAVVEAVP